MTAAVSAAHRCDEDCTCPEHGTQLFWSRSQNLHACQDATCRFAHGLERHPDYSMRPDFREKEWRP